MNHRWARYIFRFRVRRRAAFQTINGTLGLITKKDTKKEDGKGGKDNYKRIDIWARFEGLLNEDSGTRSASSSFSTEIVPTNFLWEFFFLNYSLFLSIFLQIADALKIHYSFLHIRGFFKCKSLKKKKVDSICRSDSHQVPLARSPLTFFSSFWLDSCPAVVKERPGVTSALTIKKPLNSSGLKKRFSFFFF